jgi:hypothetical protein
LTKLIAGVTLFAWRSSFLQMKYGETGMPQTSTTLCEQLIETLTAYKVVCRRQWNDHSSIAENFCLSSQGIVPNEVLFQAVKKHFQEQGMQISLDEYGLGMIRQTTHVIGSINITNHSSFKQNRTILVTISDF